nr:zinc finger, CCHC-type [Tanacetum cinerariifolium]
MTLLTKVRCFLIHSGLSKVLWSEDTTMYTYLVNRSPSSVIEFKTPIDMLGVLVGFLVLSKGYLNQLRSSAYLWDTVKDFQMKDWIERRYGFLDRCVSQSRFYNEKLVQTLLEGHSILSLEGSISGDCDVKKNDVGMLDKFDCGLQTDVQVFMDFDYTIGRSITVMGRSITSGVHDTYEGCKEGYLAKWTRNRIKIRAKDSSEYCYRCLVKGYPWFKVPAYVEFVEYRYMLIWY